MPIFEYRCRGCEENFEKLVSSSKSRVRCPQCSSRSVERKFSLFGSKSGGKFTGSKGGSSCSSCSAKSCKNCS